MTGGASSQKDFLNSTEMLVEGDSSWTKVDSLTLPEARRGPFMINIQNTVFLTGTKILVLDLEGK